MKNIQLSKNFWLKETTWSQETGIRVEPDQGQIQLHKFIAETTQTLFRDRLDSPVKVESGQRDRAVYLALLGSGKYKPSSRSDHFFGESINGWRYSTGAWDLSFLGREEETIEIYDGAHKFLSYKDEIYNRIGQMILYPAMQIIHIANSLEMVYSEGFARFIRTLRPKRQRYLVYHDNRYMPYVDWKNIM
jgi:hypothetical protein